MKGWLLIALAACGGGGGSKKQTTASGGTGATGTAPKIRERVKAYCGDKYQAALPSPSKGDGCEWTMVKGGRGRVSLQSDPDNHVVELAVTVMANHADAETARTAAFDLVHDLFDADGAATVQAALKRVFQKRDTGTQNAGTIGALGVRASTEIDVTRPAERWIELQVQRMDSATAAAPALSSGPPPGELASPARPVSDSWLADAKAVCTELVDMVLKSHKAAMAPANWEQGELHADCSSPDENSVARFTVTWAPGTRNMVYGYFIAELPQKKYAAIADRLFTSLLTAGQWTVAKNATKKAPLDRKFEAEGLQIGSRHETGGFFGETHEIDISVQLGYKPGS